MDLLYNLSMITGYSLKVFLVLSVLMASVVFSLAGAETCKPTDPDMLGPFYKPGTPVRSSVGTGYILRGVVLSSRDCTAVQGAQVEFWLTGPEGQYDDRYRATVYGDNNGAYQFKSNAPKPYAGRPPHIHIRVTAAGFKTLITQHYPEKGSTGSNLDIVLIPSE